MAWDRGLIALMPFCPGRWPADGLGYWNGRALGPKSIGREAEPPDSAFPGGAWERGSLRVFNHKLGFQPGDFGGQAGQLDAAQHFSEVLVGVRGFVDWIVASVANHISVR